MLKSETILSGAKNTCPDCGKGPLNFKILKNLAGYYIGTECDCDCGPCYSRETIYLDTKEKAQFILDKLKKGLPIPNWICRFAVYEAEKVKDYLTEAEKAEEAQKNAV